MVVTYISYGIFDSNFSTCNYLMELLITLCCKMAPCLKRKQKILNESKKDQTF